MPIRSTRNGTLLLALLAAAAPPACAPEGPQSAVATEADADPRPGSLSSLAEAPPQAVISGSEQTASVDTSRRTAIVQAASRVAPAVVNVSVISREAARPESLWESFFMPPGVKPDEVAYYIDLFKKVRETPEWKKFMVDGAFNQTFMTGPEYVKWVAAEEERHRELMKEAGFLAK